MAVRLPTRFYIKCHQGLCYVCFLWLFFLFLYYWEASEDLHPAVLSPLCTEVSINLFMMGKLRAKVVWNRSKMKVNFNAWDLWPLLWYLRNFFPFFPYSSSSPRYFKLGDWIMPILLQEQYHKGKHTLCKHRCEVCTFSEDGNIKTVTD